ncbi:MAG: putative toxin-antitoxin system toxin component, PIN family [Longimicrobiaceae bacterium]
MADGRTRVCLDLNVFVAAEIAKVKGHHDSTPVRLVDACRAGRFDLVVSRAMLERLTSVLCRPPLRLSLELATERTELIAELAALPNPIVAGGGVMPLRDVEDRGVLETALAGRARYLATYNLADFVGAATRDPDTGDLRIRDLSILHPAALAAKLGISPGVLSPFLRVSV